VQKVAASSFSSALKILGFNKNVGKLLAASDQDVVVGLTQIYPLDIYRAGGGVYAYWMRLRYPSFYQRLLKYLFAPVHPAMLRLEKKIMKPGNCRYVITNSRLVKGHMEIHFDVSPEKIRVIYNGIDHSVFNPELKKHRKAVRERLGIGSSDVVALFVSNNWKRKGFGTIVKAMAKAPYLKVLVVGRGSTALQNAAVKRMGMGGGNLFFAGASQSVEQYYGAADFFVLPTRYDPCSNACLEAMASGLPVITTASNGASEFITEGKSGFVLDLWNDVDKLGELFMRLKGSGERKRMGRAAALAVKDWTIDRCTSEILELCEKVIGEKAGEKKSAGI
jgi:UDP-glucose:(heptosyl)LPS alpha-1,3-glucosyltransferase